jgi:hypothetical protein
VTSQTGRPLAASSAISRPSTVPTYTLPSATATPRLAGPQHGLAVRDWCRYRQSSRPVLASSAATLLNGRETYITVSSTIGVA